MHKLDKAATQDSKECVIADTPQRKIKPQGKSAEGVDWLGLFEVLGLLAQIPAGTNRNTSRKLPFCVLLAAHDPG